MHKIVVGIFVAVSVMALAQDADLSSDQKAAICASQGGCITITRAAFDGLIQLAYKQGLHDCNNSI